MPPWICSAIAVTSRKVSQQKSFAIGARRAMERPLARAHAAW
jgi:hypothetical protein